MTWDPAGDTGVLAPCLSPWLRSSASLSLARFFFGKCGSCTLWAVTIFPGKGTGDDRARNVTSKMSTTFKKTTQENRFFPLPKPVFFFFLMLYIFFYFNPIGIGESWRRAWQPTSVILPGESHGQRSQVGCSPWGCEESDMTEAT